MLLLSSFCTCVAVCCHLGAASKICGLTGNVSYSVCLRCFSLVILLPWERQGAKGTEASLQQSEAECSTNKTVHCNLCLRFSSVLLWSLLIFCAFCGELWCSLFFFPRSSHSALSRCNKVVIALFCLFISFKWTHLTNVNVFPERGLHTFYLKMF